MRLPRISQRRPRPPQTHCGAPPRPAQASAERAVSRSGQRAPGLRSLSACGPSFPETAPFPLGSVKMWFLKVRWRPVGVSERVSYKVRHGDGAVVLTRGRSLRSHSGNTLTTQVKT